MSAWCLLVACAMVFIRYDNIQATVILLDSIESSSLLLPTQLDRIPISLHIHVVYMYGHFSTSEREEGEIGRCY